ncbi:swarming motility protein YbiA [Halomonas elongata]|uniref:Swarming motility protein YbiA n=1 Tax=Halomonas elongata TaxID=2746 RepID=A0A1B8NYF2_HALEL|nr:NADAR family protein [Halomonas elongata]OBX34998.1 swarming motility protein YbiA [Halomonas elongata]
MASGRSEYLRTYHRDDCVVFLKTNELYGGLSNMAGRYPVRVNGICVRSAEALYQACRFPHLPDVQEVILQQTSPMTAKMKSKPFRKDSRPDWERVRVSVMRWCIRVKLAYHQDSFGRLLLATKEKPIVEESRKDSFWGAKPEGDYTLVGYNVLGRLLMELREGFKERSSDEFLTVKVPNIKDFFLLSRPIEKISVEREVKNSGVNSLSAVAQGDLFRE